MDVIRHKEPLKVNVLIQCCGHWSCLTLSAWSSPHCRARLLLVLRKNFYKVAFNELNKENTCNRDSLMYQRNLKLFAENIIRASKCNWFYSGSYLLLAFLVTVVQANFLISYLCPSKGLCHQIRIIWKWYCFKGLGMDMRRLILKKF
jgi:hypothetical protein